MINQTDELQEEITTVEDQISPQVVKKTIRQVKPQIKVGAPQKVYETKKAIFRTYQVIWYILGIIEVLLIFRIVLKILGANTQSGFTSFIYAISNTLALPFTGILRTTVDSNMIIEWSPIIAMVVYLIIAFGIVELFQLIKPTNQEEVEQSVDSQ